MKLTTIEVRGRKFEVSVDDRDGMFSTSYDGGLLKAGSLEGLREQLNRATKSVKISIRFAASVDDNTVRIGVCTGKHATNGNYLVRWEDGTSQQLGPWDLSKGCVDPESATQYSHLCRLVTEAEKTRDAFEKEHRINVRAAADAALENAERMDETKAKV